jgi:hypothetical protein
MSTTEDFAMARLARLLAGPVTGSVLAGFALAVSIGVFFIDAASSEGAANRATVAASLSTAIALMLGALALLITARVESSDYRAQQESKTDIARLLATLTTIQTQMALASQSGAAPDFEREKSAVRDFMNSVTGFAFYSFQAHKSRSAGDRAETWRVFFMYLGEIVAGREPALVTNRAIRAQALLLQLTQDDLRAIVDSQLDLVSGIARFGDVLDHSVLIRAMRSVYGGEDDAGASVVRKLHYLKEVKRVADPDLDMFLAVLDNAPQALQDALDRGADPKITDSALLRRYAAALKDFDRP